MRALDADEKQQFVANSRERRKSGFLVPGGVLVYVELETHMSVLSTVIAVPSLLAYL